MSSNPKNILCPHCKSKLKIGVNCFHNEENLSLVCKICTKIVLPTLSSHDDDMPKTTNTKNMGRRNFAYD